MLMQIACTNKWFVDILYSSMWVWDECKYVDCR